MQTVSQTASTPSSSSSSGSSNGAGAAAGASNYLGMDRPWDPTPPGPAPVGQPAYHSGTTLPPPAPALGPTLHPSYHHPSHVHASSTPHETLRGLPPTGGTTTTTTTTTQHRGSYANSVGGPPGGSEYVGQLRDRSASLASSTYHPAGAGGEHPISASASSSPYLSAATVRPSSAGPPANGMHFSTFPDPAMARIGSVPPRQIASPSGYDPSHYAPRPPPGFNGMPVAFHPAGPYPLSADPASLTNAGRQSQYGSPHMSPSAMMPPKLPPHHLVSPSDSGPPSHLASAELSKCHSYDSLYGAAHGVVADGSDPGGMNGSLLGKRRLTDSSGSEGPAAKMPHLENPYDETHRSSASGSRMTTVLCLHASVAQKSYGQEKRFLCPPPLVRITGPFRQLPRSHRPILAMSLLNEDGERQLCQTGHLGGDDDEVVNSYFKTLHISGNTTKAKTISLELSLHPPMMSPMMHSTTRAPGAPPDLDELHPAFASFQSNPCTIISKPSKKTARARNLQSCIMNGSTVCLFNRINSQTVRTKYLCVEDHELAARASQWSAFMIKVVKRAEDDWDAAQGKTLLSSSIPGADRTVTYGSQIVLVDYVTGIHSDTYIVRKVEKCRVQKDATGPVSQMQKLALCKYDEAGTPWYVSAQNGMNGDGTLLNVPSLMNVKLEDAGAFGNGIGRLPGEQLLKLTPPRAVLPPEEPGRATQDEIEDSLAWTVMGVSHFEHSFFDTSPGPATIPQTPITPFPAVVGSPVFDAQASTLSMSVSNFFDTDPHTGAAKALEVWLGPVGPLQTTILKTTGLQLETNGYHGGLQLQQSEYDQDTPSYRRETSITCIVPSVADMIARLAGHRIVPKAESPLGSQSPPPHHAGAAAFVAHPGGSWPKPVPGPGRHDASSTSSQSNTNSPIPAAHATITGDISTSPMPINSNLPAPPTTLQITFVRPDGISYASPRGLVLEKAGASLGAGSSWTNADPSGVDWSKAGDAGKACYVPKVV